MQTLKGTTGHFLALHFRAELCAHDLLQDGMEEIRGFVGAPGVARVLALSAWDRRQASFAYAVPDGVHLLADLLPSRPDPRSALELIARVAPLLGSAAAMARPHGLYAHGALSPWRILIQPNGKACIVGYGVPPVEVLSWLDEETDAAPDETIALAPPERIEDQGEDIRSDLFSLGMIAGRIALGREVVAGPAALVVEELLAGAAAREIHAHDVLPAEAREFLASLVERRISDRPRDAELVARTAETLAAGLEGSGINSWLGAPTTSAPEPDDEDATVVRSRRRRAASNDDLKPMPLEPSPRAARRAAATPAPAPPRAGRLEAAASPVPDLTGSPTLEQVKAHGRDIVTRTHAAVARATAAVKTLRERREAHPDLDDVAKRHLVEAEAHALRAEKSASSAAAAGQLLELDDDPSGALITLDLVRNGEQQCLQSAQEAENQVQDFDRAVERHRQQEQALRDARRRARENAARASDAAEKADEAVTQLEVEARTGVLGAEGVSEAIDDAVAAAERAHAAEEEARRQAEDAVAAERSDLAIRSADATDRGATAAETALQDTLDAAERARRLEAEGRQGVVSRAADHADTAEQHASAAEKALERADEAIELITSAEASDLRKRCARHASAARRAANTAARAAKQAEGAKTAAEAKAGATTASQAAGEAAEELDQARGLSDKVVALAGEAAAARATISKARAEASSLAETASRNATKARDEISKLLEDTRGVTGQRALSSRAEALEFVQTAEHASKRAAEESEAIQGLKDVSAIEGRMESLRQLANKARSSAHRASERMGEARDQAEREIAEQRRQEAARQAARQAASEARNHADSCARAVASAWTRAKAVQAILEAAPIPDAEVLRRKALEIIDIAEFQAGEAAASAEMAEEENDPGEARAHAQTALSFAERINADLPEAIAALDEAETLAKRESNDLERSRTHTEEVHASVVALARGLGRSVGDLRAEADKWPTETVTESLEALDALLGTLDADVTESEWARDRALQETAGAEALALIPIADAALQRAKDKDRRGSALRELLLKAIQEASASATAMAEARKAVAAGSATGTDALTTALEASRSLDEAISQHRADGAAVHDAKLAVREAAESIRDLAHQISALEVRLQEGDDPALVEADARAATERLEAALERAVDAETRGIAAAEEEARTRAEADRRRVEAAREEALLQVQRVEKTVERLDEALDDAEDLAERTESSEARAKFDAAFDHSEQVRARLGEVERLAREARSARDPDAAEQHAAGAKAAADEIVSMSDTVAQMVREATDLSRAAQAEAEALAQVKAEVQQTLERADEEVQRAKAEAKRVLGILREAPRDQVRTVAEQASGHVQTATQAAAKVRAAAPMASTADDLPVAQNILRACRLALERARGAADAVQALVGDALERAREQKAAQARALDEARQAALAPALESQAELKKAEGWIDAGRRALEEYGAVAGVVSGWEALQAQVATLTAEAASAQAATEPIASASNVAALGRHEATVRTAASRALSAAALAREALKQMRESGEAHREAVTERQAAFEAARQEIQEHADTTEQIAEQTATSLRDLVELLEGAPDHRETLQRFTDAAEQGAQAARDAANRIREIRDAPRDPDDLDGIEGYADEAHAALQAAIAGLEKVAVCETAFREKLVKLRANAEVNAKQQAAAAANEEAEAEARAQAEEDERVRRMTERRERFRRRQEERESPTAATDAETLRGRLRRRAPSDAPSSDTPAPRPRRRRAPENQTGALRGVRTWTPGEPAGDENATAAVPRRAARPRPERSDNPNETKADALLERLRSRKPTD